MKTKILTKKLVLKKETITLLTNNDLQIVKGGVTLALVSKCVTNCLTCEAGLRITC
ncbi:MAG TPA: class I lanthipeptide [Candidatus Kapabacteria bacterium]|nr:class I lanthipeptide [Candidatus Kapabacteria bacterium]